MLDDRETQSEGRVRPDRHSRVSRKHHGLPLVSALILLLCSLAPSWAQSDPVAPIAQIYPRPLWFYPAPFKMDLKSAPADRTRAETDNLFKFDMKFDARDEARQAGGALQGFSVPTRRFERNDLEDLSFNLATVNDTVRISVRQAQSFYAADVDYLRLLASRNRNRNIPGPERLLLQSGLEGTAGLQRLDVKVLDADWVGASAFALRKEVDPNYESLAARKSQGDFAIADRTSEGGGGKVRFGPLSATATYSMASAYSGMLGPSETRQDHLLALDLTDLRKRIGDQLPAMFWSLAPSGVYAGSFSKDVADVPGLPERTTGTTAGAYWSWSNGSANVGYWTYALDSGRQGDASYDSAGRGFDASVGLWGDMLQYYAGVSYQQSDDLAPLTRGMSRGYNAYSSLLYQGPHLPLILIDGSFGSYGYNSPLYGVNDQTRFWSAAIGFELAKFLGWSDKNPQGDARRKISDGSPSLKVFYRYYTESDDGSMNAARSDDHLIGMMFRVGTPQFGLPSLGASLPRP